MPQTVRLTLEKLAHGGAALGRHEGMAVFVPFGVPGEVVRVEWFEQRKGHAWARIVEIERLSPERVTPLCPHFGQCGGCQWQHIAYTAQLAYKEHILREQLIRLGGQKSPVVLPMLGMENPWRYRNHVQLHVDAQGGVGYHAFRSHTVIPVADCPIAHPLLAPMWGTLERLQIPAERLVLRAGIHTGESLAILYGKAKPRPSSVSLPYACLYMTLSGERIILQGRDHFYERLLGRAFRISAEAFFQNNTLQAERMVNLLREFLDLAPGETLLDAYCGVGALGLSVAPEGVHLIGIEANPIALQDALYNSQGKGIFWQGDIAQVLKAQKPHVDAIILDPPRTGCTPEALEALAACGASRIAYVSCDPATLARDIARLNRQGYALQKVQPIDLFPQTFHIEAVAWLTRDR